MADLKNIIINDTMYSGVKELSVRDADQSGVRDKFLSENFIEDYTPKITIVNNGSYSLDPTRGYVAAKSMGVNIQVRGRVEEVATTSEMDALLTAANVGNYYKYTGVTDANYINGDLYLVEE